MGPFCPWEVVWHLLHGEPANAVRRLRQGRPVLLEIELEGARQVRRSFPSAFQVMIRPPSFEELERRLERRQRDTRQGNDLTTE